MRSAAVNASDNILFLQVQRQVHRA